MTVASLLASPGLRIVGIPWHLSLSGPTPGALDGETMTVALGGKVGLSALRLC